MEMSKSDEVLGYLLRTIQEMPRLAYSKVKDPVQDRRYPFRSFYSHLIQSIDGFLKQKSTKNHLIVMPGLRGTGKTTLLFQAFNYLKEEKQVKNVLYLTCDDLVLHDMALADVLAVYEEKILSQRLMESSEKTFLLIDEAQYDDKWALALKRLFDYAKNVFVIATGSSSLALQTPDLARRAVREDILPLSFKEYVSLRLDANPPENTSRDIRKSLFLTQEPEEIHRKINDINSKLIDNYYMDFELERTFENYLRTGGFPFSIKEKSEDVIYRQLIEVLNRIIKDDMPLISSISSSNLNLALPILNTLASSASGRISYDSLAQRYGVSKHAINNIMHGLSDTGVIFSLRPYGSLSKIGKGGLTYYFMHSTLRATILWKYGQLKKTSDIYGQLLENSIASSLYKNRLYTNDVLDISFDPRKGGADFIVTTPKGDIVIECGWHKKSTARIRRSRDRASKKGTKGIPGIVISQDISVRIEKDIIFVPSTLFVLG